MELRDFNNLSKGASVVSKACVDAAADFRDGQFGNSAASLTAAFNDCEILLGQIRRAVHEMETAARD